MHHVLNQSSLSTRHKQIGQVKIHSSLTKLIRLLDQLDPLNRFNS